MSEYFSHRLLNRLVPANEWAESQMSGIDWETVSELHRPCEEAWLISWWDKNLKDHYRYECRCDPKHE